MWAYGLNGFGSGLGQMVALANEVMNLRIP
jgi:hypothetical protein